MGLKKFFKNRIMQFSALIYNNTSSKVIYYHDIHKNNQLYTDMSTELKLFKQHILKAKEKGYIFVDKISSKNNELMITFDDGFRGLYENFDFFIDNKIPVKLFLITDFINQKNFITTDEIKEMLLSGYLTIGSHTCSHKDMTMQTVDIIKREMQESKQILEQTFGMSIDDFCFPMGFHNEVIVEIGRKVGYKKLYSSIPGPFLTSEFVVKRNLVQDESSNSFGNIINGGLEIFSRRYKKQHIKVLK